MTVSECGGVMKNIYNTSWKPNHVSDDEVGEVKEIHKLISSECIFIRVIKRCECIRADKIIPFLNFCEKHKVINTPINKFLASQLLRYFN